MAMEQTEKADKAMGSSVERFDAVWFNRVRFPAPCTKKRNSSGLG